MSTVSVGDTFKCKGTEHYATCIAIEKDTVILEEKNDRRLVFRRDASWERFFAPGTWLTRKVVSSQQKQYLIVKDYPADTCWWFEEGYTSWVDGHGIKYCFTYYYTPWVRMTAAEVEKVVLDYGDPRTPKPSATDLQRERIAKELYRFEGGHNWDGTGASMQKANKAHFLDMASAVMKVLDK